MDKLEKFVKENRDSLDLLDPDPKLWNRIKGDLNGNDRVRIITIVSIAATVIFALGITFTIYKSEYRGLNTKNGYGMTVLKESKVYYGNQLSEMLRVAQPIFVTYPELRSELQKDFEDLDRIAKEISADLKDNADNREVIEALILNYRRKVEILELLLSELDVNDHNQEEKKDEL